MGIARPPCIRNRRGNVGRVLRPSGRVREPDLRRSRGRLRLGQRLRFAAGAFGRLLLGGVAVEQGDLQHVFDVLDEVELSCRA